MAAAAPPKTWSNISTYSLSAPGKPYAITVGPDGALWFTQIYGDRNIGRITTAGAITEYPVPSARSEPNLIATGPDSALWFTEFNEGR